MTTNRSFNLGFEAPKLELAPSPSDSGPRAAGRLVRIRKDSGVVLRVDEAARQALTELSRVLVGQLNLKDAQRALRKSMSQEALARCNGSRRAAAALLGVDRRYVQKLADAGDLGEPE